MLFSEIYSAYYNTVASIIACAQKGRLDSDSIYKIVHESAFPESYLTIGTALETGKWPLIKKDYTTNIRNTPTMPFSLLQKQWLKAILADKPFKLFVTDEIKARLEKELSGVEPLFTEKDFYLYDKYEDGDPYDDENYVQNFKTVLKAVHQKKRVTVEYTGRFGKSTRFIFSPYKIEYSQKDDKFRCLSKIKDRHAVLNIARIVKCKIIDDLNADENVTQPDAAFQNTELSDMEAEENPQGCSITLEIYDDRKAMERVMLAFAHFEKTAVQLSENKYRLTLKYDAFDETELVVRVLSFGPMVKVIEPQRFVDLVKKRIEKQMSLMEMKNFRN